MNTKKETNAGKQPSCLWRMVRPLWFWLCMNGRSVKALTWGVYQYRFGWWGQHRPNMKRTKSRILLGADMWVTCEHWTAPRLDVAICSGMLERYGYPRHHAYLLLWWNRHGYAWGVDFSVPNK